MKIAIDISQIVYSRGVSRYTKELVNHLLEIDFQNEYILFGTSLRKQGELKDFFKSLKRKTRIHSKFFSIPPTVLEILFNRLHVSIDTFIGDAQVFHSSDWTQPGSKAKKVTTIHDVIALIQPELFDPKTVNVQRSRLKWVKSEVDKIIAVSKNSKKDIVETLQIPPSKIVVIYEAASESCYPRKSREIEEVKRRLGIKKDYILAVTTRSSQKLAQLPEAFKSLKKNFDLSLVIVGDAPESLDGVVKTGYLNEEDLAGLYSGAKVFAFPSFYEGFGLPVLEAMACGAPVVCSNTSSLPEVGGDAAVYVDPQSKESLQKGIEQVLTLSPNEYANLKEKSIGQAKKFSWETIAKETLEVYREVASS